MPLLDRLRQELNLAGRTAQRALDEGRVRLDLYRARQSADRFAQRFGYAVFRARNGGIDLTAEYSYNRTFLNPHLTENENELLGTLRIRL